MFALPFKFSKSNDEMKGKFPNQFVKLLLKLQSWAKYLRQTLVFMSTRALEETLNFFFKELFASGRNIFISGKRLGTRL